MSPSDSNNALVGRMRRLAHRLSVEHPPAELAREIEYTLELWELSLEAADSPWRDASPEAAGLTPAAETEQAKGIYRVWSDGSCAPNPGPGGWGAIVEWDGERREISGASPNSTNNIMEMTAAIEALAHTPPGARVHLATDSRYLVDGITRWLPGWKRKGWRKTRGGAVRNRELWERLDELASGREVSWEWVRGHAGHSENERCDTLANEARRAWNKEHG